jgi:hypothetical protein
MFHKFFCWEGGGPLDDVLDVKTRLGIGSDDTSQDDVLAIALADAQAFFKDYCKRDDVPDDAESLVGRLAVVFYDRNADRYKQGSTQGAYSTTNFNDDDVPKSIKRQMRRYRQVSFV